MTRANTYSAKELFVTSEITCISISILLLIYLFIFLLVFIILMIHAFLRFAERLIIY